jgi:hypothetical protein
VTLGGRQIELSRLRARGAGGELALSSFLWAAGRDPLNVHTLKGVAGGISTRRYPASLDPLPTGLAEYATSRSAVSRRFVALSTRQMGPGPALGERSIARRYDTASPGAGLSRPAPARHRPRCPLTGGSRNRKGRLESMTTESAASRSSTTDGTIPIKVSYVRNCNNLDFTQYAWVSGALFQLSEIR